MTIRVTLSTESNDDVGFVVFYAAPVHHEHHYNCFPPGLLTFEQAQDIAQRLARGKDSGQMGIYRWVETGPE